MIRVAIIAGHSATGKTNSYCGLEVPGENIKIEGLKPEETFLFNIMSKNLVSKRAAAGFRTAEQAKKEGKKANMYNGFNYDQIHKILSIVIEKENIKNIVFDDFQYLMSMDFFSRRNEMGYEKYAQMGFAVIELITSLKSNRDVNVFILTHIEEFMVNNKHVKKLKTVGKMLDEKFTLEGMFAIVFESTKKFSKVKKRPEYFIKTRATGEEDIVKVPIEMFLNEKGKFMGMIPNDLGIVAEKMNEYYKNTHVTTVK